MKPGATIEPGMGFVVGSADRNGKVDILVDYGIRLRTATSCIPVVMAIPEGMLRQPEPVEVEEKE